MRYSSPRQAIKAHCVGCIYDNAVAGNKYEQVEACIISQCELYEYRPLSYKTRKLLKEQREAIAQ
jgi:hypothetical protein